MHLLQVTLSRLPVQVGPYEATISKGKNVAVTLNGSGFTDSDGSITSWTWSQNGHVIGTGEITSVNFKEGSHNISLTVIDDDGLEDSNDTTVTIIKANDGGDVDCGAKPNHPQCR